MEQSKDGVTYQEQDEKFVFFKDGEFFTCTLSQVRQLAEWCRQILARNS